MIKFVMGFLAFMAIWIAGCYIADNFLPEIANAWMMLYGFVVGSIGGLVNSAIKS